jgi:hypothetical protein
VSADAVPPEYELDLQLLVAADGALYALPGAILEAGRLPAEDAAAVCAAVGEADVTGYSSFGAPAGLQQKLADVNAAGGAEVLSLQNLLQRQSQSFQLLSQVLFKTSTTQSAIIKNLQ